MAATQIKIEPAIAGTEKIMFVDYPVVKIKKGKDELKFHNMLGSSEQTYVKFYYLGAKGGAPLHEFCEPHPSSPATPSDRLNLNNTGMTHCKPTSGISADYYAYSVHNPDFEPLDPVIIIEESFTIGPIPSRPMFNHVTAPAWSPYGANFAQVPGKVDVGAAGVILLIGAVVGILLARALK